MDLGELKVDVERAEAGDWVDDIPDLGDIEVRVRGFGNADYRKRQAELMRALPASKRADVTALDRLQTQLILETVLLDWRNVSEGVAPVPYSRETAEKLLHDPRLKKLRDGIIWAAVTIAESRAEVAAADTKN